MKYWWFLLIGHRWDRPCRSDAGLYWWVRPRRSDVGVCWWVRLFTVNARPALFGRSQRRGGGESEKRRHPSNKFRGLYVGSTTNIRHGILVVFANRPLVGLTMPVRRRGLLVGPTTPVRRVGLLLGPTVYCEGPPSFIWGSQGRGRGRGWARKKEALLPSNPTWGFIGGSDHAGPTWGFIGGFDCLLWRPAQLYLGGVKGGEGVSQKKGGTVTHQTNLEVYTLVRPPI